MSFNPPLTVEELNEAFPDFHDLVVLAHGGQGVVVRAAPMMQLQKLVAIKIYFPGSATERTNREIDALRNIKRPTLVSLRSAGTISIRGKICTFVITDYVNGTSLSDYLLSGSMSESYVIRVGLSVAEAIHDLWRLRIVHRDVKPSNVIRRISGECVLIDLGIARHLNLHSLTALGNTWGTSGYMSPEHARGVRQLTCKTDIFSLGVTLQECLLGQHPTGGDQQQLLLGGQATNLLGANVSKSLAKLIDSMVMLKPESRPLPSLVSSQMKLLLS